MKETIRIASGQGFWGDQLDAPKQQVERGPIDYLMLDYLAEVTMSIMQKQRSRNPSLGYARDFVPLIGEILPAVVERDIHVIANAGGVNPPGCRDAVLEEARKAGVRGARIGMITGDDILDRLPDLIERGVSLDNMETGEPLSTVLDRVQSANAYIGARPIVEALRQGAHVIITGRSTDTALTYAAMIHEFGWAFDDYDKIAAGIVAGHINECGAQASGGNCLIDWRDIPNLAEIGYPIVEAYPDGSFVVTKHGGTGGRINPATVKEQLLYEMGDPKSYITPDAVADFTTIHLESEGEDRVRVHGIRGADATDMLKVSIAYSSGYKATGTLVYTWPDAVEKAQAADRILRERLDRLGLKFDEILTEYVGWNATHGPLAGELPRDLPEVTVRWGVRSDSYEAVDRFTKELAPLVLSGPPSVTGFAGGRPKVQEIVAYWPALIPKTEIEPHLRVDVQEA